VQPVDIGSKKKYLERKVEEKEAGEQIREFHDTRSTTSSTMREAQDLEEEGGLRGVPD
jgi:hypothetical protein